MNYTEQFLAEAGLILESFDRGAIESLANELSNLALRGGRLFILGVGGSAANASHAVNDFRKLCNITDVLRQFAERCDRIDTIASAHLVHAGNRARDEIRSRLTSCTAPPARSAQR